MIFFQILNDRAFNRAIQSSSNNMLNYTWFCLSCWVTFLSAVELIKLTHCTHKSQTEWKARLLVALLAFISSGHLTFRLTLVFVPTLLIAISAMNQRQSWKTVCLNDSG